ncbi:hypothetical protein PR202_gb26168 [Eleusine coracana subsp. coracana]|uniref:Uncharacterized protein n=1 Tax=Eleusine coracana subsp. coracana TaxID=191504 RepID=A0AAV5FRU5_ELECO|nr:hypothetical protein PR202_gb26140 [Eleusine coracana subsp. coracana]GJN37237.1 hypothetical protein PR202_gb26168 [Eleusine coracana subsp. coracana]
MAKGVQADSRREVRWSDQSSRVALAVQHDNLVGRGRRLRNGQLSSDLPRPHHSDLAHLSSREVGHLLGRPQ